jgi:hypothetical protein
MRNSSIDTTMNITASNAQDLMRKCSDALRRGVDFPTLWHTVIKPHPTVAGVPVQRSNGDRTYLEIPLLTGDCLVADTEGRTVSLR